MMRIAAQRFVQLRYLAPLGQQLDVGTTESRRRLASLKTNKNNGRKPIRSGNGLSEHIQSALSVQGRVKDAGFNISFLGTGGGVPSVQRMTSATLLRLGGMTFLFDAGEGVQRQIMSTRGSPQDITRIFITHLHGDHVLGLPGLLLELQQTRGVNDKEIEVYGPPGIYNFIAANLALCRAHFAFVTVTVYELVGGDADSGLQQQQQDGNDGNKNGRRRWRNIRHSHYPEIANRKLVRKSIRRDNRGVWVIQAPSELTHETVMKGTSKGHALSNDQNANKRKQLHIMAAEVEHQDGIQTFGFTVQEQEPPKNIDPKKAIQLGLTPGPKYNVLKSGFPVESDDGTREIHPSEVLTDETKKARKFALVGDNCRLSDAMLKLCQDADVLVHEATMPSSMKAAAIQRKHATAEMAGLVARDVNARVLVLNHLSPRVRTETDVRQVEEEAVAANNGVSRVVVAHDFMELLVPPHGYEW